jgi:3-hydroxyacyl-CoA dehydrogenase/enoyl-CoA hydratase/3-hydroxybutyryl-CoA epimerase
LLDAGAIFGTGFAPFRGGPLQYAKERGVDKITLRLAELERRFGERFRPDAGWRTLIASTQPPR